LAFSANSLEFKFSSFSSFNLMVWYFFEAVQITFSVYSVFEDRNFLVQALPA